MSTIPKAEVIEIATMSNGLQIWKMPNKEVGGFIYYSEENGAPLPALVEALISIECLEIILNDMKKTQGQLATDGREELEKEATEQKEKQVSLVKEIKQLQFDEAFLHTEITALQSSLKEKEKECEELKRQYDELETFQDNITLRQQIEELKVENERLRFELEKETERLKFELSKAQKNWM